ncbi:hypothetical protein F5Y10DRAFT_264406 [Nemania abortiva]|nr:hypothetical protein F5Y10DRAFT_264406 [Nemania abortiva]
MTPPKVRVAPTLKAAFVGASWASLAATLDENGAKVAFAPENLRYHEEDIVIRTNADFNIHARESTATRTSSSYIQPTTHDSWADPSARSAMNRRLLLRTQQRLRSREIMGIEHC